MSTTELAYVPDLKSADDVVISQRRVLHIVNGEHYAGAERVQDLLGLQLPGFRYECGFACVKPKRFPDARMCKDSRLWQAAMKHPFDYSSARRLASLAAREGFDLIHSHTPRSAWAASIVARANELPWVHTQHDVSFEIPKSYVRRALDWITIARLRRADAVIGVSPAAMRLAGRLRLGRERHLVLNGVPASGPLRERATPEKWSLGFVALMRAGKGIEVLLRAMAELQNRDCPVQATFVGVFESSQFEAGIRQLVQDLGIGSLVDFPGFSEDVSSHLQGMDLFIIPSTSPEGLPMVLLEALAHGIPVVGSRVDGIADVIRHNSDGLLFACGSHHDLADAVERFIKGQCDWPRMRAAAHQRHAADFSAARMAEQTAAVYDRVVVA